MLSNLFELTGGDRWAASDGWLGSPALEQWHGVRTDRLGRVTALDLSDNGLTGSLPGDIARLERLTKLRVDGNALVGRLPLSLTDLYLDEFRCGGTELCAPAADAFRAWLGGIVSLDGTGAECAPLTDRDILTALYEATGGPNWVNGRNWLSGAQLRHWHGVEVDGQDRVVGLHLVRNGLSGLIPQEVGGLSNLRSLNLSGNELTGGIPRRLGGLSNLRALYMSDNGLTGGVPQELGGLETLTELELAHNQDLAGAIPAGLKDLRLESLQAAGTDLCVPLEPGFDAWLANIADRRIALCGNGLAAYLVQAVQSPAHPVPLVAGEDALLRVFVTAARQTSEGMPTVRARFYLGGAERHVAEIPLNSNPIPTELDEGDLSKSMNAEIPGRIVRPGLEMVVEVDPDGTLDPGLGVPKRIPEAGRMTVEVRELPVLQLTAIPFLWSADPDRAAVEAAEGMEADPEGHELLEDTRVLLPVGGTEVTAHRPVQSTSNNAYDLLSQTEAIRVLEGGGGHYVGLMSGTVTGPQRSGVHPAPVELFATEFPHHRPRTGPQHEPAARAVWNGWGSVVPVCGWLDRLLGTWLRQHRCSCGAASTRRATRSSTPLSSRRRRPRCRTRPGTIR